MAGHDRPRGISLVTGAYGFLGRHVAARLAAEGWQVVGLGHGGWTAEDAASWGVSRWEVGDVTFETLNRLDVRPDLVVHCAGGSAVGASIEAPRTDFQRTVACTMDLLDFLRLQVPDAVLVCPSSAGVYGTVSHLPIAETAPLNPVSPYGFHKLMAEQTLRSYSRTFGLRTAAVRLFSVYGPHLRKQLLWDACRKLAAGNPTFGGSGEETRDFIHVDDAVSLLLVAAAHASVDAPVVNGGTGTGTTIRRAVELVASHFTSGNPTFSGQARAGDPQHYLADMSLARDWGWKPRVGIEQGIADYVAWFKDGSCDA